MRFKTNFLKKSLMYYLVGLFIVIGIQFIFHNVATVSPMNTINDIYGIETSLTEMEALDLLKSNKVTNIVENENMYIFKTVDDLYYKVPVSDTVAFGINLAGVSPIKEVEKSSNGVFVIILVSLILFFLCLLISFIVSLIRERMVLDTVEKMATSGGLTMPDGEMGGMETKESKKEEIIKLKKVTFDDVQGIDELKPDLYRLVDCLKNPQKYEAMGARMPKGMVLYGPPGTGKTLTAKALAGEAGVPFFSMCGSDFMEKYVGVGASRIRDLYKKARKVAPCIVFIDEIDAIGGGRGEANSSEKDQTINALLAELDGFKTTANVLTICATNRLDILDPALLRAGRFDLKLAVGLPDKAGRIAILKLHSKNKKLDETVNIETLADRTMGFSGADLENLLNESALIAANENKQFISNHDIEEAIFKIVMDGNKKKRKVKNEDAVLTAWHEAGHTLATKLLTNTGVPMVTIIPSTSGAGGVTMMAHDEDNLPSKKELKNEIKIAYAGRAGEELLLGNSEDITTGASADIKQATSIIKSYISAYGMGEKGLLDLKQLTTQYDIVDESSKLAQSMYKETIEFLTENIEKLRQLAETLFKKETLYEKEINEILGLKNEVETTTLNLEKVDEGNSEVETIV